jgi:uncharacterized protein
MLARLANSSDVGCPDCPDCRDCGVCCYSTLETYVRVSGDDYARLGEDAEQWVKFVGNRAYLRMLDGHCAALQVAADRQSFFCNVYENRPEICRLLERGSRECQAERLDKAGRPSLDLAASC